MTTRPTYWRPSSVGELILALGLMVGALTVTLPWWARAMMFAFGWLTLIVLKGQEESITKGER